MNILLTGGAGYIGSHLVELLLIDNNVIVCDNLVNGYEGNLHPDANFRFVDITIKDDLEIIFKTNKIDSIIHLASLKSVQDSEKNISAYTINNIVGSLNLISLALDYKVEKFIFSSTAAVYGNPVYNPIDELHPLHPINHYGFTKLYVENYLKWISKLNKINYICLRYFNVAGYSINSNHIKHKEKNPKNLIPVLMEVATSVRDKISIFGSSYDTADGTCIRDYIHVVDIANAHIKALEYLNNGYSDCFNLSANKGFSVLDVIGTLEKIIDKKIPIKIDEMRKGDPSELIASSEKAKLKLGWVPKYSIEEIIDSTYRFYLKCDDVSI